MKITSASIINKTYYDQQEDILWVVLKEGVEDRYEEVAPDINLEYDKEGTIIGFELLNASKQLVRESSLTSERNVRSFNRSATTQQGFSIFQEIKTFSGQFFA